MNFGILIHEHICDPTAHTTTVRGSFDKQSEHDSLINIPTKALS